MLRLDELDLVRDRTRRPVVRPGRTRSDSVLGTEHSYVLTGSVREHAGGRPRHRADHRSRRRERRSGARRTTSLPASSDNPRCKPGSRATLAAAAAPFGPVFDAELALARRAAHTLELPDCQTRYRAFRRGTDPALFPEASACFQSLVDAAARARARMGRPRDAVHRRARVLLGQLRRRLAARARGGGRRKRRWSSTATNILANVGVGARAIFQRRPRVRVDGRKSPGARARQPGSAGPARRPAGGVRRRDAWARAHRASRRSSPRGRVPP